ncbi:hypothetical protein QR680_018631 [Steinernema hermaphroditum]|uniref:C-type lectin domain-containing protein n=1 Tax=Steinernema hermaphroditum TaxID=289476 RepID=A0AA39LR19_9BILA|nr:hypothetical protein QR680_018631 [Steinernema hermaphroditum]
MLKFVLVITTLLALSTADSSCPSGWFSSADKKKCFHFVDSPLDFNAAQQSCVGLGGNLASIDSKSDNNGLKVPNGISQFWLGGHDVSESGVWTWTDGSVFGYTNWAAGQPSNMFGDDCLLVDGFSHLWSSSQCTQKASYLCEAVTGSSKPCPQGYLCHGSYSYQLIGTLKDWHSAELFCNILGGHLASVHNTAVQEIVQNLLVQTDRNRAWIGAKVNSNKLTWTDGSSYDFNKWDSGNSDQKDSCVANFQTNGWQNADCNFTLQSICEIPRN